MSIKHYKDLLNESWDQQTQLLDLLKSCFERIYGESTKYACNLIESDLECFDQHRFIHSLKMIDADLEERSKRLEAYKKSKEVKNEKL